MTTPRKTRPQKIARVDATDHNRSREFGSLFELGVMTFEGLVPWAIIGIAIISLLYAWWLRGGVLKKDKGTPKMQKSGMPFE